MSSKILVIGLDCAPPELIFDRLRDELPNISRLIERGCSGRLRSTIPPITVPAWMSMMTGKDPGTLGVYGLRNRSAYDYAGLKVASAHDIHEDTVWDLVGRAGGKVIVVGVPQTYPVRPVHGLLVSSFLTPSTDATFTHPPGLRDEVFEVAPDYSIDVPDFRSEDRGRILDDIRRMTTQRFRLLRHFLKHQEWQFAMMVEMGTDRIHHAFWRFFDESHRDYQSDSPFSQAIPDYYRLIDDEIGQTLPLLNEDTTVVLVSDHGAKRIDGGFCTNEWLVERGYLSLRRCPETVTHLDWDNIDWSRTRAWGEGGYYARIFLNVEGREPNGTVPPSDYDRLRDEIARRIESVRGPEGRELATVAYRPDRTYREIRGYPPDLIVYLDDLYLRSIGSVGHHRLFIEGNDAGPDDANHAQHGVFVAAGPGIAPDQRSDLDILDVAPTVLARLGLPIPEDFQGRNRIGEATDEAARDRATTDEDEAYTDKEKNELEDRLRALGYL